MEKLSESGLATYMVVLHRNDQRRIQALDRFNSSRWIRAAITASLDSPMESIDRTPFVLASDRVRLGFSLPVDMMQAVDRDRQRPVMGGCPRALWFRAAILRHLAAAEAAEAAK